MKRVLKGIAIFFALVLTLLLMIGMMFFIMSLNIRKLIKSDNISSILSEVDTSKVLIESDKNMWNELVNVSKDYNISENDLSELINSEDIKMIVSRYVSSYIRSAYTEEEVITISKEEYVKAFNDSIDKFNKNNDNKIDNYTKAKILDIIELNYESLTKDLPTKDSIQKYIKDNNLEKYKNYLNSFISDDSINSFVVIFVILSAIIIGLRFKEYGFLLYFAFVTGINALAFITSKFIVSGYNLPSNISEVVNDLLKSIQNNLATSLFVSGFIFLIVTIFLILVKTYAVKSIKKSNDMVELNQE